MTHPPLTCKVKTPGLKDDEFTHSCEQTSEITISNQTQPRVLVSTSARKLELSMFPLIQSNGADDDDDDD